MAKLTAILHNKTINNNKERVENEAARGKNSSMGRGEGA
jgi:hypothetical protein